MSSAIANVTAFSLKRFRLAFEAQSPTSNINSWTVLHCDIGLHRITEQAAETTDETQPVSSNREAYTCLIEREI